MHQALSANRAVICIHVYPRTHITSEMCIPTPPDKSLFYFCCFFCEVCESSSRGLQIIQDYEQQKSNDSRQNNRNAVSGEFASSWAAMLM